MQYLSLAQQGFYEPFQYLGKALRDLSDQHLARRRLDQEATLQNRQMGITEAYNQGQLALGGREITEVKKPTVGIAERGQTLEEKKATEGTIPLAGAQTRQTEAQTQLTEAQRKQQELQTKFAQFWQGMLTGGVQPPSAPAPGQQEWRPPMKLPDQVQAPQTPGSANVTPGASQLPNAPQEVPVQNPRRGATPNIRTPPTFINRGVRQDGSPDIEPFFEPPDGQYTRMETREGVPGTIGWDTKTGVYSGQWTPSTALTAQRDTRMMSTSALEGLNKLEGAIMRAGTWENPYVGRDPNDVAILQSVPRFLAEQFTPFATGLSADKEKMDSFVKNLSGTGFLKNKEVSLAQLAQMKREILSIGRGKGLHEPLPQGATPGSWLRDAQQAVDAGASRDAVELELNRYGLTLGYTSKQPDETQRTGTPGRPLPPVKLPSVQPPAGLTGLH